MTDSRQSPEITPIKPPKRKPMPHALSRPVSNQVVKSETDTRLKANILRDIIHGSNSVQLVIAMAISGDNMKINLDTGEPEVIPGDPLDQGIRAKYLTLLTNKVLSAPKSVSDKTEDNHSKWIEALDKADEAKRDSEQDTRDDDARDDAKDSEKE